MEGIQVSKMSLVVAEALVDARRKRATETVAAIRGLTHRYENKTSGLGNQGILAIDLEMSRFMIDAQKQLDAYRQAEEELNAALPTMVVGEGDDLL